MAKVVTIKLPQAQAHNVHHFHCASRLTDNDTGWKTENAFSISMVDVKKKSTNRTEGNESGKNDRRVHMFRTFETTIK